MRKLLLTTLLPLCVLILFPILSIGKSPQESFYHLGDLKLEMRSIATKKSNSITKLKTKDGEEFDLNRKPLLTSNDFEGIGVNGEDIILYIKKQSWGKTREITSKYLNMRLALTADGVILLAPVVREPLSRQLQISWPNKSGESIKTLTQKLKTSVKPVYLENTNQYELFLQDWVLKHPNDYSANYELMILYFSDSNGSFSYEAIGSENCKKAIPILQKLKSIQPDDREAYSYLSLCYLSVENYDESLKILNSSLNLYPDNEKWLIYPQIATVYQQKGSYDKALNSLERAKTLLSKSKLLPDGMTIEMAKMFNSVSPSDDISEFETIEELENHLKQSSLVEINTFIEEINKLKKK